MYKQYVLRRLINGLIMYAVILLALSFLFNTVNDKVARGQIEDQIRTESTRLLRSSAASIITQEQLQERNQKRREQLVKQYRLDRPMYERVLWRTANALTFNFGYSTILKSGSGDRNVWIIIREVLPRTILLFTTATVINLFLGIIIGLRMAQKPGKFLDRAVSFLTMGVAGMPTWWFAMIMIMFFSYALNVFPSGGIQSLPIPKGIMTYADLAYHMVLPVMTLMLINIWPIAYIARQIVLSTLQEDFIMSARARGIPEKYVLYSHTLRSAAPPITTLTITTILGSFNGLIIFESIFSWPGMGLLYFSALQQNDVPVLMGNLTLTTLIYLGGLVFLDIIYGLLDPRIKVGGKA